MKMTKIVAGTALAAGLLGSSAGVASASHDHFILRVDRDGETQCRYIAHGQTSKAEGDGGFHAFHHQVHAGHPGADDRGTDIDKADDPNTPEENDILEARCDNVAVTGSHPDRR